MLSTNNTQTDCTTLINSLNTTDDIKNVLYKINRVASSEYVQMKHSLKDLFIISPSCKELSKIAKCYERIITTHAVYKLRGTRTYLELAFPNSLDEREYAQFFASSRIAAATQNNFSGVFLISFEKYCGARELMQGNPNFNKLNNFIEVNKSHTSFIFHVKPDFKDADMLFNELSKHLNLIQINHFTPDKEVAIEFLLKKLKEAGIKFSVSAEKEFRKFVHENLGIDTEYYKGYETLEQIAADLNFEFYSLDSLYEDSNSSRMLNKKDVQVILSHIDIGFEPKDTASHRRMGFI